MNISLGETLIGLRKANNLVQKDVAEKLSDYGFQVKQKTIYNWEKEYSQPSIHQLFALCEIFGVDDVLWQFTGNQKGILAGLNKDGRVRAREQIDLIRQIDKFRDEPMEVNERPRMYRLYDIPVSAGTGNFLYDSGYTMINAPAYVPDSVDFALRVSGDSMIPQLSDGQVIWIKEQVSVKHGDIGIFTYDGDVYCKELLIGKNKTYLKSLNPDYEDIEVKEDFGFKTIGKVIS
ncbi:MAG: XRE family transcriptional regulator [Oscillospiraceae bacterium]|nr:XRE family transcriptional regulator [Oscillospiraceae bacterium]